MWYPFASWYPVGFIRVVYNTASLIKGVDKNKFFRIYGNNTSMSIIKFLIS